MVKMGFDGRRGGMEPSHSDSFTRLKRQGNKVPQSPPEEFLLRQLDPSLLKQIGDARLPEWRATFHGLCRWH